MGRQHFAVGIDVHAGSGRLFEQFFKILQIMSADENTRIFAHPDIDFGDFGIAVGGRIGFVEQCHGFDSAFANVQNQRRKRVCIDIRAADFGKRIFDHRKNIGIGKSEVQGVLGIGCRTFYPVNNHLFERTDIFVFHAQYADPLCCRFIPVRGRMERYLRQRRQPDAAFFRRPDQFVFHRKSFVDTHFKRLIVEISVGNRTEQCVDYLAAGLLFGCAFIAQGSVDNRLPANGIQQYIHQFGRPGQLAANSLYRAAFSSGRFLTLKTEHFHNRFVFSE